MRTWSISICLAACGPIYPDAAKPPPQPPPSSRSGPPGGADPWTEPAPRDPPTAPAPPDPRPDPDPPMRAGPRPQPRPRPGPPGLSADAQALLDSHNRARARHCAGPLTWSPQLAQVAQQWASSLRDQGCKFGHSGGRYGENLAAGTTGTLDGEAVTAMWYDEVREYAFPNGGFSMRTGHFTQVVWRETTQIGCAMSQCNGNDIWVCEYDPPGNVQGMYREQVLPTGCR